MSDSQRVRAVLGEQIRCAEEMLDALAKEHAALAAGNHDSLVLATNAKGALVTELERLEAQRQQLAAAAGADETDWARLRELVARCKEQNQKNGALLKARADNVRVALQALRGAEPELYGATGRAPPRAGARPLGTA
jgi:flagella synthesis protein FlgN